MLKLLAERRELSVEIIKLKNEDRVSIRDRDREKQLLIRLIEAGREHGLDTHYVSKIFQEIISDSIRIQNRFVLNSSNDFEKPICLKLQYRELKVLTAI